MPTFGKHEAAQRLFQTGLGGIFAVKGDDKKVLRVMRPPAGIWSEEHVREEIDGFLLRAKTQQVLAKSSKNWATVYETGTIRADADSADDAPQSRSGGEGDEPPTGAFAVLDRYERSVQALIDGRVNLTNDDLRNVLSGVIRGLLDIRAALQRPHGNLKATNILLANSTDLAAATVCLSDPLADGGITPASANKDLEDLAKLLYELVNLRPYQGGTIGRSKEWDKLGPNGEDWRKLCNALLDAGAPAEERDLEKILPAVATWTAKPKKNRKPLAFAAVVLFLLVAGGVTLFFVTRPKKLDFDAQSWEKLCLSYAAWFGDFADHMADDATRKKFSAAPYPTEIPKLFADAGKDLPNFAPKKIAAKPADARDLAAEPTESAKTGYGPNYTDKGVQLIDAVSAALAPAHWPLLGTLDKTAKQYEERGWQKPAAGIRAIIEAAKPPVLPATPASIADRAKDIKSVDVFSSIDKTIVAAKSVTDIDARWARIQDQLKKLPAGAALDVPLLKALPKFAEDFPRSQADPGKAGTLEDVTALATSFNQIEQVISQLVTNLNVAGQQIDFSELAKDPAVQLPDNAALTPETFTSLPTVARAYVKLATDPRQSEKWSERITEVQTKFIDPITRAKATDVHLPALKKQREDLEKEISDWGRLAAIEKNRAALEQAVAKAKSDLAALNKSGEEWVAPYLKSPGEFIADKQQQLTKSPLASASPPVRQQWAKAHQALIDKLDPFKAMQFMPYEKYEEFDAKFKTLEKDFADIEALVPTTLPGLSAFTANDWRRVIATQVATVHRETALKEIIAKLPWQDDLPRMTDPAFVSFRTQRLNDFEKSRTDALALINDYSTITDRLNRLQLLPNEPAGGPAGAKSWRDLFTAWQQSKNPLLADPLIVTAVKPITDRVAALLAAEGVSDYKGLLANSTSAAPEIALTSWRKLGGAPVTEGLPVLDDEDKIEAALSATLAGLNKSNQVDNAHLQALTAEIAAQRPLRWHRWADTVSSEAAVQTALDRMASFKVTLAPQIDAPMMYNQLFYALRKEFAKNLKEAELKPIAQKYINDVNALPPAISQNPAVQDLLARMGKSLAQSQEESSSAGAGPKLAGWEQDNGKEGVRLFYFPSKAAPKYTLEFVRMQVNNKTIFLCTSEMSFGLFADTINASNRFPELINGTKPSTKAHWFKVAEDPWQGPRVWRIVGNKFIVNNANGKPLWLFPVPQMGENPYYPPGAEAAPPSNDMPMQYISPWAAIYAARLLGCRLPTSDEWQAAYDRFEAPNAAPQKDAWNLRGAAFQVQKDYAQKLAASGLKFPDDNVYLPTNMLFDPITAADGKPWNSAKTGPAATAADAYKGSVLWFRKTGAQPGVPADGTGQGGMHDLVGNVAEYAFDGTADKPANGVVKDNNPKIDEIDALLPIKETKSVYVVGGSSLSPPQIGFNKKQQVDLSVGSAGYPDVGFRLAYTAPIDSIVDVLASAFKEPKYLPVRSGR